AALPLERAVGRVDERQQIALDLDASCAVEIAEMQLRIDEDLQKRLAIRDPDRDAAVARRNLLRWRIPKRDRDVRAAEAAEDLLQKEAIEGRRLTAALGRSPGLGLVAG